MNILNFFKKGKIKKAYLGMPMTDFYKTKISKKIIDKIYYSNDDIIFITSIGIEIRFLNKKINSISIDPNYNGLKIGNLKIDRSTSLSKILKIYHKNNIEWKFNFREKENECEVITLNPYTSIIFTFDKDDFWMSKILLSNK